MAVEVEGLTELRRTMRQAGIEMKELKVPNRAAADVVTPVAKARAPRGSGKRPGKPSGRLAASVRAGATQNAGIVRAGKKLVPYAGPIHWGWPKRKIKSSLWLMKSARDTEPAWLRVYTEHVDDVIDKIKGK